MLNVAEYHMHRRASVDIHWLYWLSVPIATGAALIESTRVVMWAFAIAILVHAMYETKSTPYILVMLAPSVLTSPFVAGQCMALAAYVIFFAALETSPSSRAVSGIPNTVTASASTDDPVENPVAHV